jgi:CrcB protein
MSDPFESLPVDPDTGAALGEHHRRPRVKLDGRLAAAIVGGGVLGGLARYGLTEAFPTGATAFPWATFAINVSGALGLAVLLVVILEVLRPNRLLRPAIGTGFFGAYTTWSSYMVQSDELLAHHRPLIAVTYFLVSAVAGLAAAAVGLLVTRRLIRDSPGFGSAVDQG